MGDYWLEGLDVLEAIRLYTMFFAHAGFEEASKGSLEPGKLAELTEDLI